jgi:membrane-bound serine protease (ClpP class)
MAFLDMKPASLWFWLCGLIAISIAPVSYGESDTSRVAVLTVADAIGPATQDYIERSFEQARASNVELIIIRMDTPGGLDGAMRGIIKLITASDIPVATYVSPTGARAASAGTYILYASHISAMAPGTNLGAATPVQIGGMSFPGGEKPGADDSQAPSDDVDHPKIDQGDAMKRKLVNDASAYIRGLAELHGRNADWAELAVREAASLEANEALEENVIDVVASDIDNLLEQIDGREVQVGGGKHILHTAGSSLIEILPDWRNRLLSVITNPNVSYILMMIGIYGLVLEFYNPGGMVAGTVGAICLVLALYSFQLLPVNYAGVALILLGVGLMIAEAFQPSFGMLGIGGLTAFIFGSIILMDTDIPDFRIYFSVVATVALVTGVVFVLIVGMAIRARSRPVVSGVEELIGKVVTIAQGLEGNYANVHVHSELWRAHGQAPLQQGQQAKVTAVDGLTLEVEILPVTQGSAESDSSPVEHTS